MTTIVPPDIGMNYYQQECLEFIDYNKEDAFRSLMHKLHMAVHTSSEPFYQYIQEGTPFSYEDAAEELSKILWSVSTICYEMGIPLSDVAKAGLYKKQQFIEDYDDQH